MKTISDLADVINCVSNSTNGFSFDTPQDEYDHIEALAIRVLDSEFNDYPVDLLETTLMGLLKKHQLRLGLDDLYP